MFDNRNYTFFVSSTIDDLSVIRKKIFLATAERGQNISSMEQFQPGQINELSIKEAIDRADVFVIILAQRYGTLMPNSHQSYTEYEFHYASEQRQLPILAFILNDEEFNVQPKDVSNTDYEKLRILRAAVKRVSNEHTRNVVMFSLKEAPDYEHLLTKYRNALDSQINGLRFSKKGGWVRASDVEDNVFLGSIASQNPFFRTFVHQLEEFNVLSKRCREWPHLKVAAAEHFLEQYLGFAIDSGIRNIFFESGSSIAFLAARFLHMQKNHWWLRRHSSKIYIKTNNVLAQLLFSMSSLSPTEPFPYGPATTKYGATFGDLTKASQLPAPHKPRSLSGQNVQRYINDVCDTLKKIYAEKGLIFMTTSGVELDPNSSFYGPHVGTYYNQLFKRAIFQSGCPTVMFLDQDKFPKAFEKGDCYNICDEKLTWKQVCTKKPFAISLACETEEKKNETQAQLKILGFSEFRASHYSQNLIYEMLTETGFTEEVASRHSEHEVWPLIAVNDVFLRRLTSSEETGGQKREKRKVKT